MSDLTLLKLMQTKENYELYRHLLKDHLISSDALVMINDFEAYFNNFKDHIEVNLDVFSTWFTQFRHPNMKSDKVELYRILINKLKNEVLPDDITHIKSKLDELDFATLIGNYVRDFQDGKMKGDVLLSKIQDQCDLLSDKKSSDDLVPWDNSPLDEVLEDLSYDSGLKFRLQCLDERVGSIHASKFVIVGAYVDSGKSTFLADLCSYYAEQASYITDKWYSGRPIIWFNNEGSSKEIRMYCMQSSINGSRDKIYQEHEKALEIYNKKTKDLIKVIQCQGWTLKEAERIIKQYRPCVVVYDMLDNFGGFEDEGTVDLRYRKLYDYARQMADKHNHAAIATSQCIGEANGVEKIPMHMLTGSRVAKQSTADLILMIGKSLEHGKERHRYLSAPKNKLTPRIADADRGVNQEVRFDGLRKRFLDPIEVE